MRMPTAIVVLFLIALAPMLTAQDAFPQGTTHKLAGSPQTIHWGFYNAQLKPVLNVKAGDTVTIVSPHGLTAVYLSGGIPLEQIPKAIRDINEQIPMTDRMGSHILTGPVHVDGAEPGDVLEVQIQDVKVTAPFGFNLNYYGMGFLAEDFPFSAWRVLRIDLKNNTTEPIPGVVLPLHPFFGSMGVAPPANMGKVHSSPPNVFGGNLDIKELVAGSTLYLPVHVKGALFSVGDGHAVMGDGEVCLTALETAELTGTFKLNVRKGKRLMWPRAETPTHFITMGFHEKLEEAAKMAVRDMIKYLTTEKGMTSEQAYMLTSLAVDLRVSQLVNGSNGIHAMLPKSIFKK